MRTTVLVAVAFQLLFISSVIRKNSAEEVESVQNYSQGEGSQPRKGDQQVDEVQSEATASTAQGQGQGQDIWFVSLAWNIVGYATIVIPAAFIIRMIKNSSFNEKEGRGCMFRTIQLCIFGTPEETASLEEGPYKTGGRLETNDAGSTQMSHTAARLILCVAGLQVSYLTWGVLQERVMTRSYTEVDAEGSVSEVKFKNSQFLVFVNRVLALTVAGIYILLTRQPRHTAPLYSYSYSSFSNILSSWCQYEALKFVSFPTQVLAKASKMIPVMLMGKIVSRKTYPYYEYFVAVMLSVGVSLFLLSAGSSSKKHAAETTVSGALILLGYMLCDSFTSNWQSELFKTYKMSSMQMMFGTNIFSSIFTLWSMIQGGNFFSSIAFMMNHPLFAYHVLLLSLCSATGQLFIFFTIKTFGPIVFVIIMTTRQVLSILLSCIIYRHSLAGQALIGVAIVFVALFLRIYARYRTANKGKGKGTG